MTFKSLKASYFNEKEYCTVMLFFKISISN